MGQQQLLLIILGVIIIGVAVAVGISVFTASATAANRDAVSSDITNLSSMAQQHYRRTTNMGGGARSFDGSGGTGAARWQIPAVLDTTPHGFFSAIIAAQSVTIFGVGLELGDNPNFPNSFGGFVGRVELKTTVLPDQIITTKLN